MSEENTILRYWLDMKEILDATELDMLKNAKGVYIAGVRLRHGMRALNRNAQELIKLTLERDRKIKQFRILQRKLRSKK
jgi:hypothetical protein